MNIPFESAWGSGIWNFKPHPRRRFECSSIRSHEHSTANRNGAFTLIEVMISSALMALILVASYICFSAAIASRKTMEPRLDVIQNARVAMALMSADLRSACPLDLETPFVGMHRMLGETVADNLDFATHHYTPKRDREGDFCQLSYYLAPNPETGLMSVWRRLNPTIAPDPLSGGSREEIATGVLGLQFEYFDGLDWHDNWGDTSGRRKMEFSQREQPNLEGLPEAVRITLWFDADPTVKPKNPDDEIPSQTAAVLKFRTIAHLNLARLHNASGANSAASDTATSSAGGAVQ